VKDASLAQVPEDPVEDTELQLAPRLKWDGSVQDGGTGLQILHYLMTRTGLQRLHCEALQKRLRQATCGDLGMEWVINLLVPHFWLLGRAQMLLFFHILPPCKNLGKG